MLNQVGAEPGADAGFKWWEHVFDDAAKSIDVVNSRVNQYLNTYLSCLTMLIHDQGKIYIYCFILTYIRFLLISMHQLLLHNMHLFILLSSQKQNVTQIQISHGDVKHYLDW